MRRYTNAKQVLPPELVREIQKHVERCYVWVPARGQEALRERNAYIVELYCQGTHVDDIADRLFMSQRGVYHALKKCKGD